MLRKGKKEHIPITIGTEAAAALDAWIAVRGQAPGPLFTNLDRAGKGSGRLTTNSVRDILAYWSRRAREGVKNKKGVVIERGDPSVPIVSRVHALRHSAITRVYALTKDPMVTKEFAGHEDIKTTTGYIHDHEDAAGVAAELLDQSLKATLLSTNHHGPVE